MRLWSDDRWPRCRADGCEGRVYLAGLCGDCYAEEGRAQRELQAQAQREIRERPEPDWAPGEIQEAWGR